MHRGQFWETRQPFRISRFLMESFPLIQIQSYAIMEELVMWLCFGIGNNLEDEKGKMVVILFIKAQHLWDLN